ncbi:MAG: hypothetical protein AAFR16_05870 [Pseudomonadota bacterium]
MRRAVFTLFAVAALGACAAPQAGDRIAVAPSSSSAALEAMLADGQADMRARMVRTGAAYRPTGDCAVIGRRGRADVIDCTAQIHPPTRELVTCGAIWREPHRLGEPVTLMSSAGGRVDVFPVTTANLASAERELGCAQRIYRIGRAFELENPDTIEAELEAHWGRL